MDKAEAELSESNKAKIAVYGGNGFVGTHVAEQLANRGICTVCLSRTGHKPVHLKDTDWSESVRWCKGDASQPDAALLSSVTTLISLVGSPPLPTLSQEAYEQQLFMNGRTNVSAINAAAEAGVKRVVVLGAKVPFPLNSDRFAYAKGKRMALEAATAFADLSEDHSAIVLQPGVIFGTRYLKSGKPLALGTFLKPISKIMPWQFISVEQVAARIVHAALSEEPYLGKLTILPHSEI